MDAKNVKILGICIVSGSITKKALANVIRRVKNAIANKKNGVKINKA